MKGLTSIILLFLSFPNSLCAAFKLTLPGGRSISYNGETGVLRIQLEEARTRNSNLVVPPIGTIGTRPSNEVMNSIQVRDTKVKEKGFGAFAIREIEKHTFLGMYEGEIIRSREALDAAVNVRATTIRKSGSDDRLKTNAMDYIMSLDGGATFIDGFERAQDRTSFSTTHLNHADKASEACNVVRLLEDDRVAFFTFRDIVADEELAFDYGSNFWKEREDK